MSITPDQTTAAHAAIGRYRSAVADAQRHADNLVTAARNAADAGRVLQPFVTTPVPTIGWDGAPPVADWLAGIDTLIAETKAGLKG